MQKDQEQLRRIDDATEKWLSARSGVDACYPGGKGNVVPGPEYRIPDDEQERDMWMRETA